MRPTTRRITAQRKFAQGAFMPPAAAAAPPPAAAATTTSAERQNNTLHIDNRTHYNSMAARNLLDFISFQNSHTHLAPIVLIERLKEKRKEKLKAKRAARALLEGPTHVMNLRPRGQCVPPKRLASPVVGRRRRRSARRRQKSQRGSSTNRSPPIPPRPPSRNCLPPPTLTPPVTPTPSSTQAYTKRTKYQKRRCRKVPSVCQSDFSLDDNRPLTYFAKSTPQAAAPARKLTTMGPPLAIPPPPPSQRAQARRPLLRYDDSSSVSTDLNKSHGTGLATYTVSERYFNEMGIGPSSTPIPACGEAAAYDTPSSSNASKNVTSAGSSSYYSEQGIHRWMDGSIQRAPTPVLFTHGGIREMLQQQCQSPSAIVDVSVVDTVTQEKSAKKNEQAKVDTNKVNDDEPMGGKIVEALTFWPTAEEFKDPMAYIEKITPRCKKFGICKIVPPSGFVPPCKADDEIRFEVSNQFISRLYNRWGPAAREMCAIKASLKQQRINCQRAPVVDGVKVILPKLYHLVQRHGGLEAVINKKKWGRVAEDMKFVKNPFNERKLDQIYVRYLLPYDTLSASERQELLRKVERSWNRKSKKLLERANNPLHKQKRLLGDSETSSSEAEEDLTEDAEDCVKPGVSMNLAKFKTVARNVFNNFFRNKAVDTKQIEEEYWRTVMLGNEHVVVNTAAIDTSERNLGFSKNESDPYHAHPWNLKMLSDNTGNVLSALGPVLGVTVPTLHLGMVWSTSCWHRDPHSISWTEFTHHGATIVRYCVPESSSKQFRDAAEMLCPTSCQNKDLWLSSDIMMIPPSLLAEHNVTITRVEQNPGEFVVVLPGAYSCAISTGYTVSESVYFATESWLDNLNQFLEIRDSCEPTMFSLEQLLKSLVEDPRTKTRHLHKIKDVLDTTFSQEINNRATLVERGVRIVTSPYDDPQPSTSTGRRARLPTPVAWNCRDGDECEVCRSSLYLSKVTNLPSKGSTLCLEHALKLLDKPKYSNVDLSTVEIHYRFSTEDVQETIAELNRRLVAGDSADEYDVYKVPSEMYESDYDSD